MMVSTPLSLSPMRAMPSTAAHCGCRGNSSFGSMTTSVCIPPVLKPLAQTWEAGHLAIIQGVTYPNPSRSHFVSRGVWHTARRDPGREQGIGWLGRGLDDAGERTAAAVYVGDAVVPVALRGRLRPCISLGRPEECRFVAGLPSGGPATLVPPEKLRGNDLLAYAQRAALDAAGTADLFARTELASGGSSYPATPLGRRLSWWHERSKRACARRPTT